MLRAIRAMATAVGLSVALAAAPAMAQPAPPPGAPSEGTLLGLAVYSSDGQRLGEITQVGMSGTQRAVRAEIGGFLGLGPRTVLIPADMFVQKQDRIELAMTAEQVRDTLSQQQKPKPKQ